MKKEIEILTIYEKDNVNNKDLFTLLRYYDNNDDCFKWESKYYFKDNNLQNTSDLLLKIHHYQNNGYKIIFKYACIDELKNYEY